MFPEQNNSTEVTMVWTDFFYDNHATLTKCSVFQQAKFFRTIYRQYIIPKIKNEKWVFWLSSTVTNTLHSFLCIFHICCQQTCIHFCTLCFMYTNDKYIQFFHLFSPNTLSWTSFSFSAYNRLIPFHTWIVLYHLNLPEII